MEIGEFIFNSKAKAETYTRDLINKLQICELDKENENFIFFHNLLLRHDEYDDKVGKGIKSFMIKQNKLNNKAYEIFVKRIDDTLCVFSWRYCIGVKLSSDLIRALRYSISKQILKFKNNNDRICQICNNNEGNFHVDHIKPFTIIKDEYIKLNKLTIPVSFIRSSDNNIKFKKEDKEFKKAWLRYHKKEAQLQILCDKCNLKKSNKIN
jgi:hypothetical protein